MAGSTKAQQIASINKQQDRLKLRKAVIDSKDAYDKAKAALKAANAKARGN